MKKGKHFYLSKFSNRILYSLISAFILLTVAVIVYAVAPNPGHAVAELEVPSPCSSGQVLEYNGTTWICGPDDVGTGGGGGDITDVIAGTGLSGGGTTGSVTLSANTAYLQRLVFSTCAAGNSIRVINSDGTVTCEADTDTDTKYEYKFARCTYENTNSQGLTININTTTQCTPVCGSGWNLKSSNATYYSNTATGIGPSVKREQIVLGLCERTV